MVAFSGPGGRLSAEDTADYEQRKWDGGSRHVVGLMRDQQWGVAVELADLVEEGRLVCRYRLVREVAAVKDAFAGEGRRGCCGSRGCRTLRIRECRRPWAW